MEKIYKRRPLMSKIGAIAMCAAALGSMAIPALAADTANINMSGNGTFVAYKLMDLETALKPGDTCTGEHNDDCYAYRYTINNKYQAAINSMTSFDTSGDGTVNTDELLDALSDDNVRDFGDTVYEAIRTASITPDETAADGKFENVSQGYYLIAETATNGTNDMISLVMLDTAGMKDINVEAKEDIPVITKTVADTDSNTFVESVLAGIGESVTFKLTGTLPSATVYAGFDTYTYSFHDTLPAGLTYVEDSMTVKIGDTDITDKFTATAAGSALTFACNDIKGAGAAAGDTVTLTYRATVNGDVAIGNPGNANNAYLEFSNDPYGTGTGQTLNDVASVFSLQLTITKVDGEGTPLDGAEFTLTNNTTNETVTVNKTDNHTFVFKGLGDGTYTLSETTVPTGYTKADDLTFTIKDGVFSGDDVRVAQTLTGFSVEDEDGTAFADDEMTITVSAGTLAAQVENTTGTKLPITGGAGMTALVYGAGAVITAIGVASVALRKKETSEE